MITSTLMMEAETGSETVQHNSIFTLLNTQEDFTAISHHEGFKS
jgi:hypothetical protein